MELVRNLFVYFLFAGIALFLLHMADLLVAWYHNQARPQVEDTARRVAESIRKSELNASGGVPPVNASEYDVMEKSRPYFSLLDVTLALAFAAGLLGVFIYSRERS